MLNTKVTHGDSKCGAQGSQECVEMLGIVWLRLVIMMDRGMSAKALEKANIRSFPSGLFGS